MTKPDDSSLSPDDLRIIEERAKKLLDSASAWGIFPTPVEDILAAAKVKVAPTSIFYAAGILAYLKGKAAASAANIKSAISKIFGVYDGEDAVIHIDNTVVETKQRFLKLHETGHHDIPTHRKIFKFFQDCEKNLAPEIADQFEREANNFARYALFQGNGYAQLAADSKFEIKTPMALAKKFGASIYASAREFARTHHKACVVYILEPVQYGEGYGAQAAVRRIEPSLPFKQQFGIPNDTVIGLDHELGKVLPLGRKMTRPTSVALTDKNGLKHDCVAEAFDTTHNIIVLLYPVKALTTTIIIMPAKLPKSPAA